MAVTELTKGEKSWDAIGDHQKEGDVDIHEDALSLGGLGLDEGLNIFSVVHHILSDFNLTFAIKSLFFVLFYILLISSFRIIDGPSDLLAAAVGLLA